LKPSTSREHRRQKACSQRDRFGVLRAEARVGRGAQNAPPTDPPRRLQLHVSVASTSDSSEDG
jgi:hypothetical protein